MLTIRVDGLKRYRIMRVDTLSAIKEVRVSFAGMGTDQNFVRVEHPFKAIAVLRYHQLRAWRQEHKITKIFGFHPVTTVDEVSIVMPGRFKQIDSQQFRKIIVPFIMLLLDATWRDDYELDRHHNR